MRGTPVGRTARRRPTPAVTLSATLSAVAALAALAVVAGCSAAGAPAPTGTVAAGPATASGTGAAAPGPVAAADVAFAAGMVPHHEGALEMAATARERAADPRVRALAARIEAAQAPEIATMRGWLAGWAAAGAPSAGADEMAGMADHAAGPDPDTLSGAAWDRAWLTAMTEHHRSAVAMARVEQRDGVNPAARELAGRIAASQGDEIAEMAALLASPR